MPSTTLLALAFLMQAAPAPDSFTSDAVEGREEPYWITEYPIIIQPLVHDYRRCLNYADRRFRGEADFEEQYAADLPRCEKLKQKLIAKSERALRTGRWGEVLAPERAGDVFRTVADEHVARGRDFDRQLMALHYAQQARQVSTELTNEEIPTDVTN